MNGKNGFFQQTRDDDFVADTLHYWIEGQDTNWYIEDERNGGNIDCRIWWTKILNSSSL